MRRRLIPFLSALLSIVFLSGCATSHYTYREPSYEGKVGRGTVLNEYGIDPATEDEILALDPDRITEKEIKDTLSHAPAPRIMNIHGGIYPVHLAMKSFSLFLIGMGYPEAKIRNPKDGSYSYSCYESSEKLAGIIAWYYEKEGMSPMVVGHSQGGIQAVKVLHELAGSFGTSVPVWNPLTDSSEERYSIIDPLTGEERPVVGGVEVSYASAVGAGGLTRFLPNQWSMIAKLRKIPDSVEEFTGFYMGLDLLGGDLMGFSSVNSYEPNGTATVRNVRLPAGYSHVFVPVTKQLAESQEIKDWINDYVPTDEPELNVTFQSSSANILWAADVWHSVKKHWCLEAQRLIRSKRAMENPH
ncbi:MAG TPA: hypothetical protein VEI96_07730 [Thermodesulfovibrionales bacterium]|nr:hypothetical protein [Thermodesulfovibrionales bacterium]